MRCFGSALSGYARESGLSADNCRCHKTGVLCSGPTPYTSTALFQIGRMLDVKERFDVVMNYGAGHDRTLSQMALFLVGACVFVLSYAILPQPNSMRQATKKMGGSSSAAIQPICSKMKRKNIGCTFRTKHQSN